MVCAGSREGGKDSCEVRSRGAGVEGIGWAAMGQDGNQNGGEAGCCKERICF